MQNYSSLEGSRAHYQGLDFLRGLAAIIVVAFHFSSRINLLGLFYHGYLAVDFFFVLSGFVINRAYGGRLASGEISFKDFLLLRVVRLLPLVICGTILAGAIDLFRPGDFSMSQHVFDIVVTEILSCLLLPTFWKTTLEQTTYPLNGPVWSLFFELIANLCYALFMRIKWNFYIFAGLALLSLVVLIIASFQAHNFHFGPHKETFLLGFPRVFFSFSLGVLLSQIKFRIPSISKWFYAVIMLLILAVPELPAHLSGVFDIAVVCVVFPGIVLGAAQCTDSQVVSPFSRWSGEMSYPLYALHYPLVRSVASVVRRFDLPASISFIIACIATVLFAYLASFVSKAYDVPVRRWLTSRLSGNSWAAREIT